MKMIAEYVLNAEDVRGMMLDWIGAHLSVKTEGYRSSTAHSFNLLLKAVAEGSSLEVVSDDCCGSIDGNTLCEQ